MAEEVANLGHWDADFINNKSVWSNGLYRIIGIDPHKGTPTYKEFLKLVHPDDRERLASAVDDALSKGVALDLDYRIARPGGEERFIHSLADLSLDKSGHPTKSFGVIQDITEQKRAEEALQEERNFSESLIQMSPTFFVAVSPTGQTLMMNGTMLKSLGYEKDEVLGKNYLEAFVPEDDRELLLNVFNNLADLNEVILNESQVLTRDGRKLIVEWHTRPMTKENGELDYFFSVGIDIMERKKSEEELRESAERFRALFEGSLDAVFIIDPESGKILDANPIASQLLLRDHDEIVGLHHLQLYPPHWTETAEKTYAKLLQSEELQKPLETAVLRSDGTEVPVEALVQTIQIDGIPVLHGVVRDIGERKQMVEELRRSEELFRTLAEASLSGIFIFQDGTFRYANPALGRIFGYDVKEMIRGMKPLEVTHPEDREAGEDYIRQCLDSREKRSPVFSFRGVQSNGNVIDCELLAGVVDYKSKPALIGTILDVTALKRREEELVRTQKIESLGVLAGGIAHDFNNILTAISTNMSMARMYGNLEDDISQMIADAEKASLRAKNLTQQLLAFAKGGMPIKKTVSIVQLLRDTAEFALSGSNVRSEYSIPGDVWFVVVDEGQITQVINNLVINADQAMPAGGTIKISAKNVLVGEEDQIPLEKGRYVKVSVADQGTGISQKHLNKIFDPFFTTKQKGSGLGLAISFTLVKTHGGHIGVHSELDIGTTVDVYLPASEEAIETVAREKEAPIKGEGRVLLIDDDEMIRRSTGEMLKRFGYDMKLAKNGEEGLKFYKKARESERPFDAVIMDLTIRGGMGGKETIQELMKIDPDAKVIVSSGYSDDPVMSEFGAYGFVGMVEKPYRIKDLGALLGKIIAEERR